MNRFFNNWSHKNALNQLMSDFVIDAKTLNNVNILFADYHCTDGYGDAFILFEKDNKLYEVNATHCSCFGLEGQWNPEEVVLEELKQRLEHHHLLRQYKNELNQIIDKLLEKQYKS